MDHINTHQKNIFNGQTHVTWPRRVWPARCSLKTSPDSKVEGLGSPVSKVKDVDLSDFHILQKDFWMSKNHIYVGWRWDHDQFLCVYTVYT